MDKVIIEGILPDLNEYTKANRANKFYGAEFKKQATETCALYFRKQCSKIFNDPINLVFNWYMPNKKKDKDNICFAKKFILDGMIAAGTITNDGWKNIKDFSDRFYVDKENPRVEVQIITVTEEK